MLGEHTRIPKYVLCANRLTTNIYIIAKETPAPSLSAQVGKEKSLFFGMRYSDLIQELLPQIRRQGGKLDHLVSSNYTQVFLLEEAHTFIYSML